jgi:choline dehydrogenase
VASLCCAVLKPRSRGRVTIASPDPAAAPLIDLAFLTDESDLRRLTEAVREAGRMFAVPGLAALAERPDDTVEWGDSEEWIRANVRSYHHPTGTCAMGPDPARGAVVDAAGRVHGVAGLMVADASVLPEIPSANTNLPTLMVAERLAAGMPAQAIPG